MKLLKNEAFQTFALLGHYLNCINRISLDSIVSELCEMSCQTKHLKIVEHCEKYFFLFGDIFGPSPNKNFNFRFLKNAVQLNVALLMSLVSLSHHLS